MKRKLSIALATIALFCTDFGAFAVQQEPSASRYDTEVCTIYLYGGGTLHGSRCYPPKADGPCTRESFCN